MEGLKNNKDANTWAMLCHLSALFGIIFPFGNIIGPLIIWVIKKDQFPFVDKQGKEALNFQISVTLYMFIESLLCFILIALLILSDIGFLILIAVLILLPLAFLAIVPVITAAVKSKRGEDYSYPLTIRFLK